MARCDIIPPLGKVQLTKLEPTQVQALLNRKLEKGLAPRTVTCIRAILRQALGQAMKWGQVPRNVATLVNTPKVELYAIQPLSPTQASHLLDVTRGDRLEALYHPPSRSGCGRVRPCGCAGRTWTSSAASSTSAWRCKRSRAS